MGNKFTLAFALVAICGLALVPMSASADSVGCYLYNGAVSLNGGTLDIQDNAVVFTDPAAVTFSDATGPYTGISAIEQACYDSFNNTPSGYPFVGASGVTSSVAGNADTTLINTGNGGLMGIAMMLNNDGYGDQIYTSFFGVTTPLNSIILRYTYMGDTLLRGYVDASDYDDWLYGWTLGTAAPPNNYVPGSPGMAEGDWFFGNFSYVNGIPGQPSDYDTWLYNWTQLAMNGQGGTLQPLDYPGDVGAGPASAVTPAVPEPSSIVMLLGGLIGLFSVKFLRRRAS